MRRLFIITTLLTLAVYLPGYAESTSERAARLKALEEKRKSVIIMCHRGASGLYPENTMQAFAASLAFGADGVETDIRRTKDGVLVIFHDDMLERLTDGLGTVEAISYAQFRQLKLRDPNQLGEYFLPTFDDFLSWAKKERAFIHLDPKRPGLEDDISAALTRWDVWDHLIELSQYNTDKLRQDKRFRPLRYKAAGLFEGRVDWNPEIVRQKLAGEGELIMGDEPRLLAHELGRKWRGRTAVPSKFERIEPEGYRRVEADEPWNIVASLDKNPGRDVAEEALVNILRNPLVIGDTRYSSDEGVKMKQVIIARSWAARALEGRRRVSESAISALEDIVQNGARQSDWLYHGLDMGTAAQALAKIGNKNSAKAIIKSLNEAEKLKSEGVTHWRNWYLLEALGKLDTAESRAFLFGYINRQPEDAAKLGPLFFEPAAKALMRHKLTSGEIELLLKHPNQLVKSAALEECTARPTPPRLTALKSAAPWALELVVE